MRLNGRKRILAYLNRSMRDKRAWRSVREEYLPVMHYLPKVRGYRVWTTSEEMDDLDRARALTLADVKEAMGEEIRGAIGGADPRAVREILKIAGLTPEALGLDKMKQRGKRTGSRPLASTQNATADQP